MRRALSSAALGLCALALGACEPGLQASDSVAITLTGGTFVMGSIASCTDSKGVSCGGDRAPHPVKVSSFALDATEVSQLQYAACAQSGACPSQFTFDADHKDEPALVDDPDAARAYCASKGLRLPTEAEFEFAARVGSDGALHIYPWGDEDPGCDRLAFAGCGATRPPAVGTVGGDVSSQGVHDLAGSVPEWVDDSYVATSGCVDRIGYGELCWGQSGGCIAARCASDGTACAKGCLPPSEDVAGSAMGGQVTSTPICPSVDANASALVDPVVKTPSGLAVIRGGSFSDGRCALAGYTRRHAEPRRFAAGFRCAKTADGATPPTAAASYRFRFTQCPAGATAEVTMLSGISPAAYTIDVFPSRSAAVLTVTAMGGVADGLPCDGTFVIHPQNSGAFSLRERITATAALCVPDPPAATFDLTGGGDIPSVGVDEIVLPQLQPCGG